MRRAPLTRPLVDTGRDPGARPVFGLGFVRVRSCIRLPSACAVALYRLAALNLDEVVAQERSVLLEEALPSSLYLFFGTTNEVAVQKFKDGLWEVDGVTGQRLRDPRDPNQMSFDILQPDFTPLAKSIIELLETREHSMAELCRYALLETIYKDTHVKPVVDSLIGERKVEVARTGRLYEDRVLRLAPTSLF